MQECLNARMREYSVLLPLLLDVIATYIQAFRHSSINIREARRMNVAFPHIYEMGKRKALLLNSYKFLKFAKKLRMDSSFKKYEHTSFSADEMIARSENYYKMLDKRRSVREFSDKSVPKVVIENIIKTASSAPSGAHKQPWTFAAISNPALKQEIRTAAEKEEYENYHGRMSDEWLDDLRPFNTDWNKEFLTIAPWLIVVFKKSYDFVNGEKKKNYYVQESVGIATGFLISAIHQCGLITLTHTPSPLNFLAKILNRPENEKPYLLLPVGYPSEDAVVPVLERKGLEEIAVFV